MIEIKAAEINDLETIRKLAYKSGLRLMEKFWEKRS